MVTAYGAQAAERADVEARPAPRTEGSRLLLGLGRGATARRQLVLAAGLGRGRARAPRAHPRRPPPLRARRARPLAGRARRRPAGAPAAAPGAGADPVRGHARDGRGARRGRRRRAERLRGGARRGPARTGPPRASSARQTRVLGALESLADALEPATWPACYRDAEWEGFRHGASGQPGDAPVTEALALRRAVDRVLGPEPRRDARRAGAPSSGRSIAWPYGSRRATPTASAAGCARRSSERGAPGDRDADRQPGAQAGRRARGCRSRRPPARSASARARCASGPARAACPTSAPPAATAASTPRSLRQWLARQPARSSRPPRQGAIQISAEPTLADALRARADLVSDAVETLVEGPAEAAYRRLPPAERRGVVRAWVDALADAFETGSLADALERAETYGRGHGLAGSSAEVTLGGSLALERAIDRALGAAPDTALGGAAPRGGRRDEPAHRAGRDGLGRRRRRPGR